MIRPEGKEMAYALQFNFKATNNEAEYQALITGLKMAQSMQAQCVDAFSDSQVVVQQVQGSYEARDSQLKKYLAVVRSLMSSMEDVSIQRIPRSKNKRADALSKLVSSTYSHLITKVFVEVLPSRSTENKQVTHRRDQRHMDDSYIEIP